MLAPPLRRLCLVTGASAGIGAAFASAYAARGCDVALVARRKSRLDDLAAALTARHGVNAIAIAADLGRNDAEVPVLSALAEHGRHVDILVNNAGFGIPRDFIAEPWARQREFLMTMAVTPCALAHAVLPGMMARGDGAILNVASMVGYAPGVAGNTLYPAVKSLMIKFSQSLNAECRGHGVSVTAVCPGTTLSEFAQAAGIPGRENMKPGPFTQTAEAVVAEAIRANLRGRAVVITGWHNRLAVTALRALPESLVRAVINAGAARFRPKE